MEVRAAVCSKLGLNDWIFDSSLRDFVNGERLSEASFRLNFDRALVGSLPPTEQAFRLRDRSGREQSYTLITLIPRTERIAT